MQSDDRLAALAEKLKGEIQGLPQDGGTVATAPAPIQFSGNGSNINLGGTQVNISSAPQELLTPDQRRRLNRLVTQISADYEADPRVIWKEVVHTRTGVSSVEEIPRGKFAEAEQALLDHAEQLHTQSHARSLVSETLALANQTGSYKALTKFCSREFGTSVLNKLTPDQLKAALSFVEERGSSSSAPKLPNGWVVQLVELWSQRPMHMAVTVVLSAILGRVFL